MNVTVKIDDQLLIAARHRAVDAGQSLSAWLADLVEREVHPKHETGSTTLLDLLGDPKAAGDFDPPFWKEAPEGATFETP